MTAPMWRQPGSPDIVRHNEAACPHCHKTVDSASTFDGRFSPAPRSGDFSFCIGCGKPSAYSFDAFGQVSLRHLTDAELAECLRDNTREIEQMRSFRAGPGAGRG